MLSLHSVPKMSTPLFLFDYHLQLIIKSRRSLNATVSHFSLFSPVHGLHSLLNFQFSGVLTLLPVHDLTLYLVCPGLLVAIGETSYRTRVGFIGSTHNLHYLSSSSCSLRVRCIPCSLILKVELVPPSLLRSSNVPSSFWSVFQCLSFCPSSVRVVATFSGIVLFPLLCSVLPFFPLIH